MKQLIALGCAALLALGASARPVGGQGSASTHESAPSEAAVEARRETLRASLRSALQSFEAMLAREAEPVRDGWRTYLRWDAWAGPALASEAWDQEAMKRNAKRLYAAEQGFEHPAIIAMRSALTNYLNLEEAVAEADGDVAGEYARRVSTLERGLAEGADFASLEAAAWWLAAMGQHPPALAKARARYSGSVIVGQIHRELVEAKLSAFENHTNETRQTHTTIQSARVTGTAHVASRAWAELANGPNDARVRVTTSGTVLAPHNISRSGSVRVSSSSRTQFTAVSEVYFDGDRFLMTPPLATADMHSRIKAVSAPWLGRRIAARRVHDSRASAERQGERMVEQQAAEAMSKKLAEGVEKLNNKSQGILNLITRTGNKAQRWSTRVLANAVEIGYLPSTLAGIGALPTNVPHLTGDELIGLSFHDAGVEGILRSQVAGAEWTDIDFSTLQRELTGGNHEEMLIGLDGSRWSAQWSWRLPVRIHFTPEGVTVCYHFSRIEIDGYIHEGPIEVRARLQVVPTPLGLELEVDGPVAVASLEPQRPLPPHVQEFLDRKFAGLFGEHFFLDGFQFPAGGHLDPLSSYRIVSAHLEPGWIHLRYTNKPPRRNLTPPRGELVSQESPAQAGR